VVATELPTLFDQFELGADAREALMRYVKGLEDWASGVIHWHLINPRYRNDAPTTLPTARQLLGGPLGLGTSAARLGGAPQLAATGSA
jgi:germacradienol/geosmin synthase